MNEQDVFVLLVAWFAAAHGRHALEIDEALSKQAREYEPGVPQRDGWTGELSEEWQCISDELDTLGDDGSGDEPEAPERK